LADVISFGLQKSVSARKLAMPAHVHGPDRYFEVAATLRMIARDIRFDHCRVRQLNALAAGFERLARRVAHERMDAAAD
jgi:hypothetical protein